eukprot:2613012-Amphidinium_carterae.1
MGGNSENASEFTSLNSSDRGPLLLMSSTKAEDDVAFLLKETQGLGIRQGAPGLSQSPVLRRSA